MFNTYTFETLFYAFNVIIRLSYGHDAVQY